MNCSLQARAGKAIHQMGVQITSQEKDLEEQHARGPHGRAAPEPRQNRLTDDGLYLEQQKSAHKDRGGTPAR
jgi:hypothetical protein